MKKFYFVFVLCIGLTVRGNASEIGCPTAGVSGGVTICDSSSTSIFLFDLITGESSGGTWTRISGSGGTFDALTGIYIPAYGATTSTFVYNILGSGICPDEASLATVIINRQPDAGLDGCLAVQDTNPTIIDLYTIIGGEDPQGVWTRTTGVGGTFSAAAGTYSPAVGATTSTFTYTTVGVTPCINDTSTATIIINGTSVGQAVTLFCDAANSTANSVAFDWNNVGQNSFNFSYTINGGPAVSGNTTISNFQVLNVAPGSSVTFTVQPVGGNCFPSSTTTCNSLANTVFESDVVAFYPNPFHDILNLKFEEPLKSILITNVLGQQVFSKDYTEKELQINLAHLSVGTYFVRAQMENGFKTFKIIKN
ncbi:MAG: T9SS type A sorting domain-containing protein [Flavobacterium sp.]|nr:T9SS type A sorting domain-containing protein [Flavobacterium sp.]